jgi:hypothetical protein
MRPMTRDYVSATNPGGQLLPEPSQLSDGPLGDFKADNGAGVYRVYYLGDPVGYAIHRDDLGRLTERDIRVLLQRP